MISRRIAAVSVVLTALLCLGTGGYVWWAKCTAMEIWTFDGFNLNTMDLDAEIRFRALHGGPGRLDFYRYIEGWRDTPWYGRRHHFLEKWVLRRAYYEAAKRVSCQDLGDNPDAWKSWFEAHPNLVWDEKLQRLVDRPTQVP